MNLGDNMETFIKGGNNLIISHASDVDGLTPPILMRLFDESIDIIFIEPIELLKVLNEIDASKYQTIYITDIPIANNAAEYINENEALKIGIKHFDHHESEINSNYSFINEVVSINDIKESATSLFYKYLLALYPNHKY
jgi:oligoribonuclease NrnB/cAMP/cGMP phosphodiesterase (DHH superfamily)